MDPRGVPAAELSTLDLEVWGLNGQPTALCGVALPVVRHKELDLFTLFSLTARDAPIWEPRTAIDEHCQLGRITLFSEPVDFPYPLLSSPIRPRTQTVLAWVELSMGQLLRLGEGGKPDPVDKTTTGSWQSRLHRGTHGKHHPNESWLWVCAESEHTLRVRFSQYATRAIAKYDELAAGHDLNWADLSRVADFGVSAAANQPDLRYASYTRYCAALYYSPGGRPESAHNVFKLFVRQEFPTVGWDDFREAMRIVMLRGKDVAAYRNGVKDHTRVPLAGASTGEQPPAAG